MENGELRDLTFVPDDYIVIHHKTDMAKRLNDKYVVYEVQKEEVPLVKCKDCIHCADDYIDVGMGTMPQFTCELGRCGESVQPDDFCSYGEREENADR